MPESNSEADRQPQTALPWSRPGLLVGVDGSPASLAALHWAVEEAPKLGLPVHALVVWDFASPLDGHRLPLAPGSRPESDARAVVDAARREVFPQSPPDWFTVGTERGRPSFVLLRHSAHSEMLVIGSRGHGGFAGLLLGSVSSVCVSHALCPVLVVPQANPPAAVES